jgi:poly-gamma-glutamate system protein
LFFFWRRDGEPLISVKKIIAKKYFTAVICFAVILWAALTANLWRFYPPDPDCVKAVSLYSEILKETAIVGIEYSSLTTTLGNYSIKKSSENPIAAALMTRLLKDSGADSNSAAAINASGSFPGFLLASLSACAALGIKSFIIASVGSSTYGANVQDNTVADILLQENLRELGFTLLAVTPGGSGDRGRELDEEELTRISLMLEEQGIPFIRPENLAEAIVLRESLFKQAGCTLLLNIGGNHASSGDNVDLALMAGLITPDMNRTFNEHGLIQHFLTSGKPVINILNMKKLYSGYGLEFDQTGKLISGDERLFRHKQLSPFVTFLPVIVMIILLSVIRHTGKNKRSVQYI